MKPSKSLMSVSPMSRRRLLKTTAVAGAWFGTSGFLSSLFAPSKDAWEKWTAHDASSSKIIDHSMWTKVLKENVRMGADGVARFDYGGVNSMSLARLKAYVGNLVLENVSALNKDEQRAYWINLYNAATVKVVIENFPVESIRDISTGLLSSGPWSTPLFDIEGESMTLNDIEHRILRPIWNDPRLHYALNCASIGCPNLQNEAFTAANTEALLDTGAKDYINHPRGVSVTENGLVLSSIYEWFAVDFGEDEAALRAHLVSYASGELKEQITATPSIREYVYDWSLNGV